MNEWKDRHQINVHTPPALAEALSRCARYHGRSRHSELLLLMALHHSETLRRSLAQPEAVEQFDSPADHARAVAEIEQTIATQRAELYDAEPPDLLADRGWKGATQS